MDQSPLLNCKNSPNGLKYKIQQDMLFRDNKKLYRGLKKKLDNLSSKYKQKKNIPISEVNFKAKV